MRLAWTSYRFSMYGCCVNYNILEWSKLNLKFLTHHFLERDKWPNILSYMLFLGDVQIKIPHGYIDMMQYILCKNLDIFNFYYTLHHVMATAVSIQEVYNEVYIVTQVAKFMGPAWDPPGSWRPQMDPMLAQWILLSGNYIQWYPGVSLINLALSSMPVLLDHYWCKGITHSCHNVNGVNVA